MPPARAIFAAGVTALFGTGSNGASTTVLARRAAADASKRKLQTTSVRVLNSPQEKIASRVKSLTDLRQRLTALTEQKLLKEQKPSIEKVLSKIDASLKEAAAASPAVETSSSTSDKVLASLNKTAKEVQGAVDQLKSDLMRKAMELAQQQHELIAKHQKERAGANAGGGMEEKQTAEDAFEKLMDVQDAPLKEQLAVLRKYSADEFVAAFLKKGFKEGDNLAMQLGQALDNRKETEAKSKQEKDLQALESSAHLNEDQARTLLPILTKVKEQQKLKERRLGQVSRELTKLEEQERLYRKRKAVLAKETKTLGDAVNAIQQGKIDELTKAMDKLKELSV